MKILLTGANGYIGQRLLPVLVEAGHHVVALVRSIHRLDVAMHCREHIELVQCDLLTDSALEICQDIEAAYYLVHSMSQHQGHLFNLEAKAAENFLKLIAKTQVRQVIYLSGLVADENLSPHLSSRKHVESILCSGPIPVTILRAGIIVGSGSASFEIMRDLVEKLPIMIAPRWVENKCQPIGIYNILEYLVGVLNNSKCIGKAFDVGGPDVLSYRQMLLQYAHKRGLKRYIMGVPVLTPRLSSYWLYFVTSTNFALARALVQSLKNNAICRDDKIHDILPIKLHSFEAALDRTLANIEENTILSSWKDSMSASTLSCNLLDYVQVPKYGCLVDAQEVAFQCSREKVLNTVWEIGGKRGWYSLNWAWGVRGFIDQLFLGTGLRRGRTHPRRLRAGDALDFWRVLIANRELGRLLLYAEMRLPGEAWLEFEVQQQILIQRATFRPKGLLGRVYWYSIYPLHRLIFKKMAHAIVQYASNNQ